MLLLLLLLLLLLSDEMHSALTRPTPVPTPHPTPPLVVCSEHGIVESNQEIGPCDGALPPVPETGAGGGGAGGAGGAGGGGGSAANTPRSLADIVHPQKWSCEQVVEWVRRTNRGAFGRYAGAFGGTDGKTMCKFGAKQLEVKCDRKGDVAESMFAALRAEMKRIDKLQKDFRNDKRSANNSIAARDYWKQPLDCGQADHPNRAKE